MRCKMLTAGTMLGLASMLASFGISPEALAKNKNKEKNKNNKAQVRRDNRDRNDRRDSRPPGWNRGRKTGWGGASVPPGQAKKQKRNRNDRDRFEDRDERRRDRFEDRDERRRDRNDDRNRRADRLNFSGRVSNRTGGFNRTITVVDQSGVSRRLSVGRDVPIYRDGRRISVHEIREGEYVRVRLARDSRGNTRVVRIDVA